jgi:CRP-like cAMP-binding protein
MTTNSQPLSDNERQNELPPHVEAELLPLGKKRRLRRGEKLYVLGAKPDGFYGVLSGRVRSSAISEDGKELLIALFEPGSWFGEISMFDGLGRTHEASAVIDSEILIVPRQAFLKLLDEKPELNRFFQIMLCAKLRRCFTRIEDDYFQPVSKRLAIKLAELARAYGMPLDEGTLIDLHLPQEELSRMVGAARPVINRELKKLEQRNVIRVQYGRLTILDNDALLSTE